MQENKSKEIQDRKKVINLGQRGRATSDKRKQSIVNTKIIGSLYQTNGGGSGGGGGPLDNFERKF